ncbi:kinase-like protein [Patellaria atrata CBS 101060]|uniref:dual-specificity kinase n=1 Tax=Patellaria atrata CBS 101060 TaxID=1346257 RepID=A0A9P4SKV6_9PEZI|nr:kinase-like protein [Patellaria atrata CBS 101060]
MSTPSTATATLAGHPQYFSHHQSYPQTVTNYSHVNGPIMSGSSRAPNSHYTNYPNTTVPSELRRTATVNSRQSQNQQPTYSTGPSQSSSTEMPYSRPKAPVDWNDFYKNGIPKEIIVIEDDTPEPVPQPRQSATNGTSRHMDKKRRTAASTAYDPVYSHTYSSTQTPYYEHSSGNNTASTDRTTSAHHTTAATSLDSQRTGTYVEPLGESVVGQKRKRTRQAAADEEKEAKRREKEAAMDPFSCYVPPPQPPIKAKEVYVQTIPDTHYLKGEKCDDEDGHYIVVPEQPLTERYQIVKLLGQGTFGKVVEAYDRRKGTKCAIKVIRSVQKYRDASRIELRVLSTLASNDKQNRNKCIHLRDCFDFRNHICIVTDLYGQSVFDFLKSNQFTPFPNTHIQSFARQLLTSVAFLHDLNLIHTDLKPENILLVNNAYQTFTYNRTIPSSSTTTARSARQRKVLLDPEIRLIDFGSATFNDEYHSSVVSTRHYRAPEIILNLGWSFPCDMWSIGCILVEFFTGDALFQTHDNLEHLAMMEAVCGGKLDKDLIRAVCRSEGRSRNPNQAAQYFKGQKLDYPNTETPKASRKYVKAMKKLHETIPPHTEFNKKFLDLLKKIFVYNPEKRITAKQALKHPWFKETMKDDGTEAASIGEKRRAASKLHAANHRAY